MKVRWWHLLIIGFFVVAFLGLAYWQWTRFQSGSGTFQNLGYALQWPLFAVFVIYAYRAGMRYENELIEAQNEQDDPAGDGRIEVASALADAPRVTKIEESFLPQRPQMDVAEFNELNKPRRHRPGSDAMNETSQGS